jgi:hypothetical protein
MIQSLKCQYVQYLTEINNIFRTYEKRMFKQVSYYLDKYDKLPSVIIKIQQKDNP